VLFRSPPHPTPPHPTPHPLSDSFMKQTYRALTCFLIDFWDHQECEPHTDPATVQQLQSLPVEKGQSKCFNLLGPKGGRICFVHAVIGTTLVANPDVSDLMIIKQGMGGDSPGRKNTSLVQLGGGGKGPGGGTALAGSLTS